MAKKKVKNKVSSKKYQKYKVEGKLVKRSLSCPKCGPGIFLAEHKDRQTCGTCHYTTFKSKEAPKSEAPKPEQQKEASKEKK